MARKDIYFPKGYENEEQTNILIIDDEEIMRNLFKDLFSDIDYGVTTVETGEAGVAAFEKEYFDVVISDLCMPGMDGIKVLEEIKKRDADAMVIMLTGYGALKSAQDAVRLGAFDYITKPFELSDITFIVKRAVKTRKLLKTNKELLSYLEQQNVILDKKVHARTQQLEILYTIGKKISSLEEDKILHDVIQVIGENMHICVASFFMYDVSEHYLKLKAAFGVHNEAIEAMKVPIGEPISGYVFQTGQSMLVHDSVKELGAKTEESKLYHSSLISVPIRIKDEKVGVLNVSGKKSGERFSTEDFELLKEIASLIALGLDNARLYRSLQDLYLRAVSALVSAIDAKDSYTRSHSENVARIAEKLARKMGLDEEKVSRVKLAGQLHDIGKIGIRDSILTNPQQLNEQEWAEMRTHSEKAVEILGPLSFLSDVVQMVKHNHERYDAKGYPDGLGGEQIELGARIIAVADAYDTMMSKRPYRKKIFSKEEIIAEFKRCRGLQFDPHVVDVLLEMLEKGEI